MTISPESLCPCGTQLKYISCCGAFHHGENPSTAEQLMRSRYTAYVVGNIEYIQSTTHPKLLKEFDFNASKDWSEKAQWLGLKILHTENGGPNDSTGVVDFEAHYRLNDKNEVYSEHAMFERGGVKNSWFFLDGKTLTHKPVKRNDAKINRNDPCPCSSGLKYKKCCGA